MRHAIVGRRASMLLAVILAVGCGGASASGPSTTTNNPPPPPPPAANTVRVTNNSFTPGTLTVATGTSVTWNWDTCSGGDSYGTGQTCVTHSVTMDDNSLTSDSQSSGNFVHQFTAPGTYAYHCAIHGTSMSGKIVVQ
jgi:plastocyanin